MATITIEIGKKNKKRVHPVSFLICEGKTKKRIPMGINVADSELTTNGKRIRSRGMCDTWMIEFFRFLLGRQKYHVEALCTAAELADIPNKWLRRWEIDGKVGFINLVNYPADVQTGLGKVEIEFYAI